MGWKLVNINYPEQIIRLSTFPYTVGRCQTANLILRSRTISKQHAIIEEINGHLYIKDTSMNGTYLNSQKITSDRQVEMKHCDLICFGNDIVVPSKSVSIDIINAYKLEEIEAVVNLAKIKKSLDDTIDGTEGVSNPAIIQEHSILAQNPKQPSIALPDVSDSYHTNDNYTAAPIKSDCLATIKQEVLDNRNPNNANERIFTIVAEVDITDDDDEFETICSQMYANKDETCERQQIDFVRIKEELQYLDDWGDLYEETGVVDLDFETNSDELLSMLQESPHNKSTKISSCLGGETTNQLQAACSKEVDQIMQPSIENYMDDNWTVGEPRPGCSKDLDTIQPVNYWARKTNEQVLEAELESSKQDEIIQPDHKTNGLHSEAHEPQPGCSKNLDEIMQSIKAKTAQPKALVIEALPMKKGKKFVSNKRPNSDLEATLARRMDLKEIANKENEKNAKKAKRDDIRKQATNVKVSDNRGRFLMMMSPPKPPIAKKPLKGNEIIKKKTNVVDTTKFLQGDFDIDIPITSESPQDIFAKPAKQAHKEEEKAPSHSKQNNANALVPIKSIARNPVVERLQSSGVEWDILNSAHRVASRTPPSQHFRSHKMPYMTHKKFVKIILKWNLTCFDKMGQSELIKSWPKVGGEVLIRLANTFNTIDHYIKDMNTLVLIEIFSECHREYRLTPYPPEGPNAISVGCIESIHSDAYFTTLMCFVYLEEKTVASGNLIRQNNFSTFAVPCGQRSRRHTSTNFFGIVTSPTCRKIKETDFVDKRLVQKLQFPLYKHSFKIVAKANLDVPLKSRIYLRNFCSLNRFFAKLDAINRTQDYLYKFILTPQYQHFKLPMSPQMQVFEHSCLPPLNEEQNSIVKDAVNFCSPDVKSPFFFIQGPPGTGKTYVILNILINLLQTGDNSCILLLAQSNAALDNLINCLDRTRSSLLPLNEKLIKMIRVGAFGQANQIASRYHVDELVRNNLLNDLFHTNPALEYDYRMINEEIGKLKKKKDRSANEEQRLKSLTGRLNNFVQQHLLLRYKMEEYQKRKSIISKANIICSTLGSCYSLRSLDINLQFKCCILDEATQASELESLMPLLFGLRKFIFVGDPKQLPPFNCLLPKEYEFHRSLVERVRINLEMEDETPFRMLRTQYRMVPAISSFPNRMFYNGVLKDHVKCVQRIDLKHLAPYLFFELDDCQRENEYANKDEIDTIFKILNIINCVKLGKPLTIGIITPYNEQKSEFLNRLQGLQRNEHIHINCNTIDSFQGQEQDIILLSFVRNVANEFVSDANRLNVALTRAKSVLYMVASQSLFKTCTLMKALKEDAVNRQVFIHLGQYPEAQLKRHILTSGYQ